MPSELLAPIRIQAGQALLLFPGVQSFDLWQETVYDCKIETIADTQAIALGSLNIDAAYAAFISAQDKAAEYFKSKPKRPPSEKFFAWLKRETEENDRALYKELQQDALLISLLSWHSAISGHCGCVKEKAQLELWARSEQPISIKFITGDGGVGKSRLAAEFATKLRDWDWQAGFVDLGKSQAFPMRKNGTLLVIDYPEENLSSVVELLHDLGKLSSNHRLRVLFLTRLWLPRSTAPYTQIMKCSSFQALRFWTLL